MIRPTMIPPPGMATPLTEPLVPPRRPTNAPTRRISTNLDLQRYVGLRTFAAENGMTGEQIVILALDRLLSGR